MRLPSVAAIEQLRPAAEAQIAASRAEAGCIDYTYATDLLDPCLIRVLERWESRDALDEHFKAPHMAVWRAALKNVAFVERDLRAHEVSDTSKV